MCVCVYMQLDMKHQAGTDQSFWDLYKLDIDKNIEYGNEDYFIRHISNIPGNIHNKYSFVDA